MGRPSSLSHHRTCGSASGGSSGNMQLVIVRGERAQALSPPEGVAQGHVNNRCLRHVPRTLTSGAQGGEIARDT